MTKIKPKYQFEMVKKFEPYMRTNPNNVTERWLSEDAPEDVKEVYCEFMKTADKKGKKICRNICYNPRYYE